MSRNTLSLIKWEKTLDPSLSWWDLFWAETHRPPEFSLNPSSSFYVIQLTNQPNKQTIMILIHIIPLPHTSAAESEAKLVFVYWFSMFFYLSNNHVVYKISEDSEKCSFLSKQLIKIGNNSEFWHFLLKKITMINQSWKHCVLTFCQNRNQSTKNVSPVCDV